MDIIGRILYLLLGFVAALLVFSFVFPSSQNFTIMDLWRFFVSPGIVALVAASIGARAGARSHIRVSEEDLARTYWSVLDLAAADVRVNKEIMETVRGRILSIKQQGRKPVLNELEPRSVHTMFFKDIEYPKLRKVVPAGYTTDIFHIRNLEYVFDRWNALVSMYYALDRPLVREEGEEELMKFLTTDVAGQNFVAACEYALRGIERIKDALARPLTGKQSV
jgi:hypothetical protein